jgi:hypothetical protein
VFRPTQTKLEFKLYSFVCAPLPPLPANKLENLILISLSSLKPLKPQFPLVNRSLSIAFLGAVLRSNSQELGGHFGHRHLASVMAKILGKGAELHIMFGKQLLAARFTSIFIVPIYQ